MRAAYSCNAHKWSRRREMPRKSLQTHSPANKPLHIFAVSQTSYGWANVFLPDGIANGPKTEITSPSNLQFVKATLGKTEELEHGHHKDGQIWQRVGLCDILRHFVTCLLLEIKWNQHEKFQHGSGNGKRTSSYKFMTLFRMHTSISPLIIAIASLVPPA